MERDEGDEGEHEGTQKTAILYFNSTNGTVDRRHPAPVDRWFIQLYISIRLYTSLVVQDFFHQQHHFDNAFS